MIITEGNHKEFVKEGVVLLDFWAPWCMPCNALSPTIDRLEKEFTDKVKMGKVNIDEEEDLASDYQISAIPSIVFLKNGVVEKMLVGIQTEAVLRTELEGLLTESEIENS